MSKTIDIERLKQIDICDVAIKLGLVVKNRKTLCFLHPDHNPSLCFFSNNQWHCFGCGEGGDVISLVQKRKECSFREACQWLNNVFFCGTIDSSIKKTYPKEPLYIQKKETNKPTPDSEIYHAILQHLQLSKYAEDYLCLKRKLSLEVIRSANIVSFEDVCELERWLRNSFSQERLLSAKLLKIRNNHTELFWWKPGILFPYFDYGGNLINIQLRPYATDSNSKYVFLPELPTCIFNEHMLKEMKTGSVVCLCEGAIDALSIQTKGGFAVAFPGVNSIKLEQLEFFYRFKNKIVFDNDSAGQKAARKLLFEMRNMGISVINSELANFKDVNEQLIAEVEKK